MTLPDGWVRTDTDVAAVAAQAPDVTSNMNILVLSNGGLSLDELESQNLAQVKLLAYKGKVNHSRVTLPAGEAIHFTYKFKLGALALISESQYLVLGADNQYVLSVTGFSGDATLTDLALSIADSIEILP